MPRKPLPKDQVARMQAARKTTARDRQAALAALQGNTQFVNPRFWSKVGPEVQDAVVKAIKKAQRGTKKAEIARLQKKIVRLQAEI